MEPHKYLQYLRPTAFPDDEQLEIFCTLAKSGKPIEEAAEIANISVPHATKKLAFLYKRARADIIMKATQCLEAHLPKNVIACLFTMKAQAGWQETSKVEQTVTVDLLDRPAEENKEAWLQRQAKQAVLDH